MEFEPLRYEASEGTEVEVQSETRPEQFHEGVVDGEEQVRDAWNGAIFNENTYVVLREK